MNTPSGKWSLRRRIAVTLAAMFFGGALIFSICVWNLLTLNRETAILKKAFDVTGSSTVKVQLDVGPVILGIARQTVRWIDDVPPEARQVLANVRGACVGVYDCNSDVVMNSLGGADAKMDARGWRRAVTVRDSNNTVVVYLPRHMRERGPITLCVAVHADGKLVVASGVVDGELIPALLSQADFHGKRKTSV
jgi:hypothetical protein